MSGVARHRVERGSSSTGPWTTVSSSVSRESYTVTGLSSNTLYYFRVSAYGNGTTYAADWSDPSDTDSARTDRVVLQTPPAPSGFSATVGGGSWIFLYWDTMDGIDDYQIESRPPDGQWMTVYTGDGDTFGNRLRVRLRLYPCDSSHRIAQEFRIQAYGDGSTHASEWGPHSSANVDMNCPPPVAHTLTVTGETSIESMWDLEAGISKYRVYYRATGSRLEADSNINQ